MDENLKRIKKLLYLETQIVNLIYEEIDFVMRDRPNSDSKINERIQYRVDDILGR